MVGYKSAPVKCVCRFGIPQFDYIINSEGGYWGTQLFYLTKIAESDMKPIININELLNHTSISNINDEDILRQSSLTALSQENNHVYNYAIKFRKKLIRFFCLWRNSNDDFAFMRIMKVLMLCKSIFEK